PPAGAGRVPVELVIIAEEAELVAGAVADRVAVLAVGQQRVGTADLEPDSIVHRLASVWLLMAVALHRGDIEADADRPPVAFVARGEFAKQAVPEDIACGAYADRLGDVEVAVLAHSDVAQEGEDA